MLADPIRWQLVGALGRSDRRVGELVQLVDKPQNLVSYHLAELRQAGIVTARRSSADGRDVYYRADLERCRDLLGRAGLSLHPALARDGERRVAGPRKPLRVLFLCTGNSARSQMAEAFVAHRPPSSGIEARSAGSHPKPLHPHAVRAMAERGIDIADSVPKSLTRFVRMRFDRVVTLCDKVREVCPEFPGGPITSHWSIPDPASGDAPYEAFDAVADDIADRTGFLLAELNERTDHA